MQNLSTLFAAFRAHGCRSVVVKRLSANDDNRHQTYFGRGRDSFEILNLLPVDDILPATSGKNDTPVFKAALDFNWLGDNGTTIEQAPGAQLILYPQYPEVRFSGFLLGTVSERARLMKEQREGRYLFMGVQDDESKRRIIGYVAGADEAIANEFYQNHADTPTVGVFKVVDLHQGNNLQELLQDLAVIHQKGLIPGKRLISDGTEVPCTASNCGGYTLEAELGITPNSRSEPDYLGWEVKSYGVKKFTRTGAKCITLMTPEPTGGFYREDSPQAFVRRYGSHSTKHTDRMDFAGRHIFEKPNLRSGLTLQLQGYDKDKSIITDTGGCVALIDGAGTVAASWDFAGLLKHWNRKHNQAVYVPSIRPAGTSTYQYSNMVSTAEGTDFLKLIGGFAAGAVFYDPGINVENISTNPTAHLRSQFRILSRNLPGLYHTMTEHDLTTI